MVQLIYNECVESTSDLALASDNEWDLFIAAEQKSGRGQRGNSWESEKGKNLLFSLLLKPSFLRASQQFYLSKGVSLAIAYAIEDCDLEVKIKWPNDIYVGDKKICGILIENNISSSGTLAKSCIGVGLNVNQRVFVSNAPNPTSIAIESGNEIELKEVLNHFLLHIYKMYDILKREDFEYIDEEYHSYLYRMGNKAQFKDKDGLFQGTIEKVKPQGDLIIRKENGDIKSYLFKEVEYIL